MMQSDDERRSLYDQIIDGLAEKIVALSLSEEDVAKLLQEAFKTANKKYWSTPSDIRQVFSPEDWRQEALGLFLEMMENYSSDKGNFECHVRFYMDRRLTDVQRRLFRNNPAVQEDIRKIIEKLRRELKHNPTPEEVSAVCHQDIDSITEIMAQGFGERRFVCLDSQITENIAADEALTPEDVCLENETNEHKERALRMLWGCIEKLMDFEKFVFRKKELEGVSLRKLYDKPGIPEAFNTKSYKNFQQNRYPVVYEKVARCVKQGTSK